MVAFLDKAKIKIESGKGGDGMVAYRREKFVPKGGPAGGDGGRGGDVYLIADENLTTLMDFKYKSVFKAQNGENGRSKTQHGKGAKDLYIKVPAGTVVKDAKNGKIIGDLTQDEQKLLVAKGGRGGRGNARFATAAKKCPQFCEPGESSVERELELELKLIADVGLIGMPNAGKSTLISAISSARPKIADYPFTTLVPNLGVVKKPSGDGFVVADIPGLIEGASEGVGLGHDFLKHIERCRFLVHLVDISAENPLSDYEKVTQELKKFNEHLASTYKIIALNKADCVDDVTAAKYLNEFKKILPDVFIISAVTHCNLKEFISFLSAKTDEIEKPVIKVDVEEDSDAYDSNDSSFEIIKMSKDAYSVKGKRVLRLASVTDVRNMEQMHRFWNILDSMGILKALREAGIKDGDTLVVGHLEMEYYN